MTAKQGNRGNGDQFSEIIENSGNTFHAKVANRFREAGWRVLVSPYYVDNATDKPREVDLVCERLWVATPQWNTEPPRWFRIQLIVECKYIPDNSATVFWFDGTDQAKVDELIVSRLPFFKDNTAFSDTTTKPPHRSASRSSFNLALRAACKTRNASRSTWH